MIPSNYGTGVSGQSALFLNYLALWPEPNHAPSANTDFVNNRYDKINVTRPTDKYFIRFDEALTNAQHLSGSISRSALTNNIPAPFKHAAESVTTDTDWSGSLMYTATLNPKTVLNVRLGVGVTDLLSNGVSGNGSARNPSIDTSQWPFDSFIQNNNEKSTKEIPPVINACSGSVGRYTHVAAMN